MRSSGILLSVSSLPSEYGIGTFGKNAYNFIDFLYDSKQKYWQILPIGHTGFGDSPYQCFSAFAGNPYFIDPYLLYEQGLIFKSDLPEFDYSNTIDYGNLYRTRIPLLKKAVDSFRLLEADYIKFENVNSYWLDDYALFMTLKEINNMLPLKKWDEVIKIPEKNTLSILRNKYKSEINKWKAIQFLFFSQWNNLKKYAKTRNVEIIGDIPIYVSSDSVEVWLDNKLFETNENNDPSVVAGCPPDVFSPMGQLWGNPVYDWNYHKNTNYDWWIKRLDFSKKLFDVIRIDHFRGFEDYYVVDANAENAVHGEWRKGPSKSFIDELKNRIPDLKIIAEDLGDITDDVKELLNYSGYPGMKILQFAFNGKNNDFLPHNYIKNCVAYTGTHDNSTMKQWSLISSEDEISFAKKYLNVNNNDDFVNDCIRALYSSVSDTVIIPMQDWLNLGAEARMNTPSIATGNWRWKLNCSDLSRQLARRIREMTELYFRDNREETI